MKRKLLVIEDNALNREILCEILNPLYDVVQAENGKEGLEILNDRGREISLILLDIQMPVMDGYEFLKIVQKKPEFALIPIIVTTSSNSMADEIWCLENGASDFVSKPYEADIVLKRAESMIRLSEASAMLNKVEYDSLTGLYSKEFFYDKAAKMLESQPDQEFDIVCSDIEAFKLVNDRYGIEKGDEVLAYFAEQFKQLLTDGELIGRLNADVFAIVTSYDQRDKYQERVNHLRKAMKHAPVPNLVVRFGLYENVDHNLPVSVLCDKAILAIDSIKHHYGEYIAKYDEKIRQKMLRQQQILDHMEQSLKHGDFEVYFQPKHHLDGNYIQGAEALVRWNHPEIGQIQPGEFIPLFEKNGFISKVDYYVWEQVCRWQREWIDAGNQLIPVSMNMSRADFDVYEIDQVLEQLANRYKIPYEYIHPEITESAYVEDPEKITRIIRRLRQQGFPVELDDFGAGYSSLQVLSELELDVLKLDMSLVRNLEMRRQACVLSCVLNMADELHMTVVAEGVETKEQADILREMGCCCAQGYYFAKPMPRAEFENYVFACK